MLNDSDAKLLITSESYRGIYEAKNELVIESIEAGLDSYPKQAPQVTVDGHHLAYILYTSGSTGKPKGVEVGHRGLVNVLLATRQLLGFSTGQTVLAVTTFSFIFRPSSPRAIARWMRARKWSSR